MSKDKRATNTSGMLELHDGIHGWKAGKRQSNEDRPQRSRSLGSNRGMHGKWELLMGYLGQGCE